MRLRFASFGYKFPSKFLEGTGLTNATVYVNAENAFTFTEWRGFDAESRDNTGNAFPTPKTFSVGFELGF